MMNTGRAQQRLSSAGRDQVHQASCSDTSSCRPSSAHSTTIPSRWTVTLMRFSSATVGASCVRRYAVRRLSP